MSETVEETIEYYKEQYLKTKNELDETYADLGKIEDFRLLFLPFIPDSFGFKSLKKKLKSGLSVRNVWEKDGFVLGRKLADKDWLLVVKGVNDKEGSEPFKMKINNAYDAVKKFECYGLNIEFV